MTITHPIGAEILAPPALRAAGAISPQVFDSIRRRMVLDYCKWDSQIGDVTTLADFPLILSADAWNELVARSEAATGELLDAEDELLNRPELFADLGIPRAVRRALEKSGCKAVSRSPRIMRFDFHLTAEGWRASEVNSDVPGGYTESSMFTNLMADQFPNCSPVGDPARVWCDLLANRAGDGVVALLSAPGYLEDFQIVSFLRQRLDERGVRAFTARPEQLIATGRQFHLNQPEYQGPLGLVLRFYQAEWLPRARGDWRALFGRGDTPVVNPPTAVLTESKRLAVIFDRLKSPMATWRNILPTTRDPREVNWRGDEWILKTAYCNTGDTVAMRDRLTARQWRTIERDVWWHPRSWIAQKRFEATSIDSPAGRIFPCIGVYTIDGISAGIYGRFAANPLVDHSAVDVAVLVEKPEMAVA